MTIPLQELFCLRATVHCAFRTTGEGLGVFQGPYGSGFRGELEVSWIAPNNDRDFEARKFEFTKLIAEIDGRRWQTAPETLLEFCRQVLTEKKCPPMRIQLKRGHDIVYTLL